MSNVRCRYCRGRGHNITGCPEYKNKIEELRSIHGNDHYSVANYDAKKVNRSKKVEDKKCSYCSEKGHTRRTCSSITEHKQSVRELTILHRKAFFLNISKSGTGIGSILAQKDRWNPDTPPTLYMVKNFNMDEVGVWNNWHYCCDVLNMSNGRTSTNGSAYGDASNSSNFLERRFVSGIDNEYSNTSVISKSARVPSNVEEGLDAKITQEFSSTSKSFTSDWRTKSLIREFANLLNRKEEIEAGFSSIFST
jgi:hypothetical protein